MNAVIYGAWYKSRRTYWEGGSSESEHLLDADADVVALRSRCNAHYTNLSSHYKKSGPPLFEGEAMQSSEWHSDGGGCGASGYIEIRPLPRLE